MKIRSLICCLAAIVGMAACTSEMSVDNKERVGLSIALSVGGEETKAVGEIEPYYEEVNVLRYHVAIFEDGKRIAHGEYGEGQSQGLQKVEGTEGISTEYKAHFDNIPEGSISVYVIANYPSTWDFNAPKWDNFSGYQAESVVTDPFLAEELVKVGYKTFTVGRETTELRLSLVQLSAGIDMLLTQSGDAGSMEDADETTHEYVFQDASAEKVYDITDEDEIEKNIGFKVIETTISNYLTIRNAEYARASALMDSKGQWNDAGKTWFNRNRDKVYEKLQPERGVLYFRAKVKEDGERDYNDWLTDFKIVAYGRDVDCDVKVPVTGLLTGETTLAGLNKESDIAIWSKEEPENTKYQPLTMSSFNTRFYTYEPGEKDLILSVVVGTGESKNVYRKKYRQYGYRIYRGRWISKGSDDHYAYDWAGQPEKFPKDAWLKVSKGGKVIDEGTGTPIRTEAGSGDLNNTKTYSLTIPGSTITKGHVYQVKGTYSPSVDVTPEVEWEVIDMKQVTVNPDPFE